MPNNDDDDDDDDDDLLCAEVRKLNVISMISWLLLAADCQLVSDEGRRQLHSANSRTCRQTDLQQLCRQMSYCCRA